MIEIVRAAGLRAELGPRINAAVDLLERALARAGRNAALSARLSRGEIRNLLLLVKRLEEEVLK